MTDDKPTPAQRRIDDYSAALVHVVAGWTAEEIASLYRTSPCAMRNRIARAMARQDWEGGWLRSLRAISKLRDVSRGARLGPAVLAKASISAGVDSPAG